MPEGFRKLIDTILEYVKNQGLEVHILNKIDEKYYQEKKFKFCRVIFKEHGQKYTYITADDDIRIGDYVWVPARSYSDKEIAKVVNIVFRTAENAPYPIEKTKHIIRKCSFGELPRDVQKRIQGRNDLSNYYDWGASNDDFGGID